MQRNGIAEVRQTERYEEDYTAEVEKEVDEIRAAAFKLVQKTHPEIAYVIDRRSIYDYSDRMRDYPGKRYLYFRLPNEFKRKEDLILAIADETLQYFAKE